MNPIDEALKKYRANNNAKWQAQRLATMSKDERKKEERLNAAASAIAKASEEQKLLKLQLQEQQIKQREEASKTRQQPVVNTRESVLAAAKFLREDAQAKGSLKIKVKPVAKEQSSTCPNSRQPGRQGKRMVERDYEEQARKWQQEEKRKSCAKLLNVYI